jgi:hypothetical protein
VRLGSCRDEAGDRAIALEAADGRLIEDDASPGCNDEGVGGSKIDAQLGRAGAKMTESHDGAA